MDFGDFIQNQFAFLVDICVKAVDSLLDEFFKPVEPHVFLFQIGILFFDSDQFFVPLAADFMHVIQNVAHVI